jgi:hypothetical protein
MSSSSDESDWKFKISLGKVAVVPLNQPSDFPQWHLALRRLVTSCNMGDSLLYTVPNNQLAAVKQRIQSTSDRVQKMKQESGEPSSSSSSSSSSAASSESKGLSSVSKTPMFVDLSEEKEIQPVPRTDLDLAFMHSLGISKTQDDFFASSVKFINSRTGESETERNAFFRHEIWTWMEQSLAKGNFKWVARSITPVFDIHLLYNKVVSLANKATWISHALEFKKIFSLSPARTDIFQYHADLQQQIRLVRTQGESLGLVAEVPTWMEQSLLLIAAWQNPQYQKIALDFTMEGRSVTMDSLIKELQKQHLLTAHLNQSSVGGERAGRRGGEADVRIRTATTPQAPKPCFLFQKGKCTRNPCPYSHEKLQDRPQEPPPHGKPKNRSSRQTENKFGDK